MKVTESSAEKNANTVDKSINQDDAWHMVKGVINVSRSTICKWCAEGPRAVQSMPL